MSNEEVYELIEKGLYVDEGNAEHVFKSAKRAEYLERAMYVCPYCGLSEFESKGNAITCRKCNRRILYGEDTSLKGDGFEFPYTFVSQWYEYQQDFVNALDVLEYQEEQFLMMYGMLTGTASTGVILLREIDGDFKTPASDNMVYQNFPAMIFGFTIMLIATVAPVKPILTLGVLVVFFIVMNIILFRSKIFIKK